VEGKSALDNSALPPALLQATPRRVRVNLTGAAMLAAATLLMAAGIWGGLVLGRRAETADRHVRLFTSERVVTRGEVVRLHKQGGDEGYRITAHYRYIAHGRELAGATRLRRSERDRYTTGSQAAVWYLASEPDASWLDGYAPAAQPGWPATAVPLLCGLTAAGLIHAVRRQLNLLTHGRAAIGTVTKVEKKNTDHGTVFHIHYEFATLSGATRRGKYQQSKKQVPAPGALIPIVYDRDNTFRHSKYPMSFVNLHTPQ